jgi:ADP-ribose pyrophosphatase YjhB (NUDIX family)
VFEAAVREVREETRIAVRPLALIDVVDLIEREPDGGRVRWHYTLIDVLALWIAGEPRAGDDAAAACWAGDGEFGRLNLWPETLRIIARARQLRAALPPG